MPTNAHYSITSIAEQNTMPELREDLSPDERVLFAFLEKGYQELARLVDAEFGDDDALTRSKETLLGKKNLVVQGMRFFEQGNDYEEYRTQAVHAGMFMLGQMLSRYEESSDEDWPEDYFAVMRALTVLHPEVELEF